jgi:hypothetical protein
VHHSRAPIRGRRHIVACAQPAKPGPVCVAHPAANKLVLVLGLDAHRHTTRIVYDPRTHHRGAIGCASRLDRLACRLVNAPGTEWLPALAAHAQRKHHGGKRHPLSVEATSDAVCSGRGHYPGSLYAQIKLDGGQPRTYTNVKFGFSVCLCLCVCVCVCTLE